MPDLRKTWKVDLMAIESILRRWDPIGIRPGPGVDDGPMDEYDSYAPQLYQLLAKGGSLGLIVSHLEKIQTDSMGVPPNRGRDEETARSLLDYWSRVRIADPQTVERPLPFPTATRPSAELRLSSASRYNMTCEHCRQPLDITGFSDSQLELDVVCECATHYRIRYRIHETSPQAWIVSVTGVSRLEVNDAV